MSKSGYILTTRCATCLKFKQYIPTSKKENNNKSISLNVRCVTPAFAGLDVVGKVCRSQ